MAIRLSTTRLDLGSANLTNAEMRGWSETVNALGNATGATTVDLSLGNVVTATTTGVTTWTVTNASSSQTSSFTLILTNGGSQTQTWPSGTAWSQGVAPTLNSSGTDVLSFFSTDAGVTWRAAKGGPAQQDQSGQKLFAWGYNQNGEMGLGDTFNRSSPVQLPGQWSQISTQATGSCFFGIKPNGTLWAWSGNGSGRLGIGDSIYRSSPVQIPGTWISVKTSGNASNTMGLRADGSLWVWGGGASGGLGLGDTIKRSSPVQLAGTWKAIAAGDSCGFGIRSDGSLWGWGLNTYGHVGLGDADLTHAGLANRSSPVQVAGTWTWVNSIERNTSFMRADGSLWFAGRNADFGNFGLGNKTNYSSPVQLTGTWSKVANDFGSVLALRHNGTLWSWGQGGANGCLGLGDTEYRSSPVQVGSGVWTAVAKGESTGMAITATWGLFGWGRNDKGALGQGDTIRRSSPVQIAGTWTAVTGGRLFTAGLRL